MIPPSANEQQGRAIRVISERLAFPRSSCSDVAFLLTVVPDTMRCREAAMQLVQASRSALYVRPSDRSGQEEKERGKVGPEEILSTGWN